VIDLDQVRTRSYYGPDIADIPAFPPTDGEMLSIARGQVACARARLGDKAGIGGRLLAATVDRQGIRMRDVGDLEAAVESAPPDRHQRPARAPSTGTILRAETSLFASHTWASPAAQRRPCSGDTSSIGSAGNSA